MWCEFCGTSVRANARGEFFHRVPGYPELETIAREVTDVHVKHVKTQRQAQPKSPENFMVVTVPGF
jgi:hypothetical protein